MVNTSNLPHTTLTAHNGARTDTGGEKNVLFVCIKKNLSAHSMVRIPRTGTGKKKEKETPVSISTLYGEDTQAPHIYAHVIELGANQFWSHPVRRTHQRIPLRSFFCQLDTVAIYICVYVCMYV